MTSARHRHARACSGHARLSSRTSPAMTRQGLRAAAAAALVAVIVSPAGAESVEDFYRGKSITLAIGYSVGGGYDLYGRLLARHLGKYIPGQPAIVPQNREGAGSLRAAIYIYNAAPKDGTVIGTFSRSMAVAPLLNEAPFDASKFTWLGSISTDVNVCMTWKTSAVKTWQGMLEKPFTLRRLRSRARPRHFCADVQERVRRQDQARHRLSGHQRRRARHGARRGRRHVRPVVVDREDAARRLARRQEGQHPGAGRPAQGARYPRGAEHH